MKIFRLKSDMLLVVGVYTESICAEQRGFFNAIQSWQSLFVAFIISGLGVIFSGKSTICCWKTTICV